MKKDKTDMTIETAYVPVGKILYESFNALGEPGPVIRSLGPPKEQVHCGKARPKCHFG